jgi:hypothetical protein
MRFLHVHSGYTIAPHNVLVMGHGLQVGRIDACPIATEMVKLQAGWNLTAKMYIEETVG